MPSEWTDDWTRAAYQADIGIKVVDSLLSWTKDGQGKPSTDERNLFMAAVAFTYGVWENYVEQLAVETVEFLAEAVSPSMVPPEVHGDFTKNKSAWEVAVSPGWKKLWMDRVRDLATGDASADRFGLSNASEGKVKRLFLSVGVDPFRDVPPPTLHRLEQLVRLRGEIVHTAQVPDSLRKHDTSGWKQYVVDLYHAVDASCRAQCIDLLG